MKSYEHLIREAGDVFENLDGVFRFGQETSAQLYDITSPDAQKLFKGILIARGYLPEASETGLSKYLRGESLASCFYTADITGGEIDYVIFVGEVHKAALPVIMGEEIIHGEHHTKHARNSCKPFNELFTDLPVECLGFLGALYVADNSGTDVFYRLNITQPSLDHDFVSREDANHFIGYMIATQIHESGKEIPYRDMFHAPSQNEMWEVVRGIVRPRVVFRQTPGKDKKFAYETLQDFCSEAGLGADIEVEDIGRDGIQKDS